MSRGLHLSFLGVDGIGKTTLARAVAELLRDRGVPVRMVSWRQDLEQDCDDVVWPRVALEQLWLETFRLLYGGADDGENPLRLPRDYRQWQAGRWEDVLASGRTSRARQAGPLAAAFVELAGNIVLSAESIRPAVERGEVVVQETFPYKHILKELLIARRFGSGALGEVAEHTEDFVASMFSSPLFQPDIGVLLDGPTELAYRWRTAESGHVGVTEDFGVAGERGERAFHALQEQSAESFRRVAKEWNWLVHTIDHTGLAANVRRGLDLVAAHPKLAPLLARPARQEGPR